MSSQQTSQLEDSPLVAILTLYRYDHTGAVPVAGADLYYAPGKLDKPRIVSVGPTGSNIVCKLQNGTSDQNITTPLLSLTTSGGKIRYFVESVDHPITETPSGYVPDSTSVSQLVRRKFPENTQDHGPHALLNAGFFVGESKSLWFGPYLPDTSDRGAHLLTYRLDVLVQQQGMERMKDLADAERKKCLQGAEATDSARLGRRYSMIGQLASYVARKGPLFLRPYAERFIRERIER